MKTAEVKPSDDEPKGAPAKVYDDPKDAPKSAPVDTRATPPAPPPAAALPEYPDTGQGVQEVTLAGVGDPPPCVSIGKPLPQSISVAGVPYDLSDRAAGIYSFRHK